MSDSYDLIAIGTGSAGSTAAYRCRDAGWSVAMVDSRPFGGTCALRGCDPKKVLVEAADAVDRVRRMSDQGVVAGGAGIDWQALMRFKRSFTDPVPDRTEQSLKKKGIAAYHGRAMFTGPNSIRVGEQELTARRILIATGAAPVKLNIPGEEFLTDSTGFLDLESLPSRIVFVGGGYISFEFAHVARRAGAEVTILHRGPRPLSGFDPDLVDQLVATTRELGIDLRLNHTVQSIERCGAGLAVRCSAGSAQDRVEGDLVVHGAGRAPEIEDLALERGNIRADKRGVMVTDYLQSVSNPAVYAAGDCASYPAPRLTPISGTEGEIVGANLLKGNCRKPQFTEVPRVVFTVPPLASVGLLEAEVKSKGLQYRVRFHDTSDWHSSRRAGVGRSGARILIEEGSNRILGAHLFGPHADEVVNLFALAIRCNLTTADLDETLFAYPTGASDISSMIE